MNDTATLQRLLMKCEEYVARLRVMQTVDEEQFLADVGLQWQVERGLQLATQACIDIAAETFRHWQQDLSCYERFCRLVRAWITGTTPALTPTERASPRSPGPPCGRPPA